MKLVHALFPSPQALRKDRPWISPLFPALVAFGLCVSAARGQVVAIEQFDDPKLQAVPAVSAPDNTALEAVTATGFGFENWIVTNKGGAGDSVFKTAGLSYPGNYDGSLSASGGSAYISNTNSSTGNATHSLKLDVAALAAVTTSDTIWFSFLAERTGATSTSTVDPINETALYPRNFGVRYLDGAGNSNSNIGTLGRSGSWSQSGDVWGQWGAKDTHGLLSDEPFANGTDFVVVGVVNANSAAVVSIWFNPDSTSTGPDIFYNFTDGSPQPFDLTGLGTEAGNLSGERAAAEWTFDEIVVGLTCLDAAGLANLCFPPEPPPPPPVLLAYYPFEGDAADASGEGNAAAAAGDFLWLDEGLSGGALRLLGDGAVAYEDGGHVLLPAFTDALNGGFTVSFWARDEAPTPGADLAGYYLQIAAADPDASLGIRLVAAETASLEAVVESGPSAASIIPVPVALEDFAAEWKMLTLSYTPGYLRFYVNGERQGEAAVEDDFFPATFAALGRHGSAGGLTSAARMSATYDNLRVYQGALSEIDIQRLHHYESSPLADLTEDDFDDGVIDPVRWKIERPFNDAQVRETGGVLEVEDGGRITSVREFEGRHEVTGTLRIAANPFSYARLVLRTDGLQNGTEVNGIAFQLQVETDADGPVRQLSLFTVGAPAGEATGVEMDTTVGVGEWYDFRITDDGDTVALYWNGATLPTLVLRSEYRAGANIAFHNREGAGGGNLMSDGGRSQLGFLAITRLPELTAPPVLELGDFYETAAGDSITVEAGPQEGLPTDYTYQWFLNDFAIPGIYGGRDSHFSILGLSENEGTWRLSVTNDRGTTEASFEFRVFTDTDGDGLSDYREIHHYTTDPNLADTDLDGLDDGDELNLHGTNPKLADSDEDGLLDGAEVQLHLTNPREPDSDGDSLSDGAEVLIHLTNPNLADSDGDGLDDPDEIFLYETNPKKADSDEDGLEDGPELFTHATDPNRADTDGDGLTDGDEVNVHGSSPRLPDSSGDLIEDGWAVTAGLDPRVNYDAVIQIVRSHSETFELFDALSIQDLDFGGVLLRQVAEDQFELEFSLETSLDLHHWSEIWRAGQTITIPGAREFLRLGVEPPATP